MSKICILSTVNLKHMTLVSLYTDYLDKNNFDYDIIYIDKYHNNEDINATNIYKYDLTIKKEWKFYRKLREYWKFKGFAKRILNSNNYEFIIVWNSFTAFMFADILVKNYRSNYCINVRDYAMEKFYPVYHILNKVITNSAFTTISSDGFRVFLPKYKYLNVHSMNTKILRNCVPRKSLRSLDEKIRITYIGYISFVENCYKLIDELGNDERYTLQFFGEGSELIRNYAINNGIRNVVTHGRFEPSETKEFIENSDVIYNLYGVGTLHVDTALSIKLYYAAYMNLPILVFKGTYMEEITKKIGIGYPVDINEFKNLGNSFYKWYHNLDFNELESNTIKFKKNVLESHLALEKLMDRYIARKEI